jgi:catechol 2,3-dioxygenase-like lactoylglutathione lyase family enzyme
MIATHGLTHLALSVRDPDRALRFYDAGAPGGIIHFGFRLTRPEDIDAAVALVERAGGTVSSKGEFAPGLPYAFVRDPDGYEIEIWFE